MDGWMAVHASVICVRAVCYVSYVCNVCTYVMYAVYAILHSMRPLMLIYVCVQSASEDEDVDGVLRSHHMPTHADVDVELGHVLGEQRTWRDH